MLLIFGETVRGRERSNATTNWTCFFGTVMIHIVCRDSFVGVCTDPGKQARLPEKNSGFCKALTLLPTNDVPLLR
jgi:hypothetical protein